MGCNSSQVLTALPVVETEDGVFINLKEDLEVAQQANYSSAHEHTWRVLARETKSGWAWDIKRVSFLDENGVEINPEQIFDSGHVELKNNYYPECAFEDNEHSLWGGRASNNGLFWIGVVLRRKVHRVKVWQHNPNHFATSIELQWLSGHGSWKTVTGFPMLKPTNHAEAVVLVNNNFYT